MSANVGLQKYTGNDCSFRQLNPQLQTLVGSANRSQKCQLAAGEGRAAEASTWQGDEQREEQRAGAAGNYLTRNGRISPAVPNTVPSTLSLPDLPCFLA